MNSVNLSQANQALIAQASTTQNTSTGQNPPLDAPKLNNNLESDTVTFSSQIKKAAKNKKLWVAAAAVALAVIGAAAFVKSAKFYEIQSGTILKKSEKIKARSQEVLTDAQKTLDEVRGFFEKGKESGYQDVTDDAGNIIRKFIKNDDGSIVMQELSKSDLARKSNLLTNGDLTIEDYAQKVRLSDGSGAITVKFGYNFEKDFSNEVFSFNCAYDGANPYFAAYANKFDNKEDKLKTSYIFNEDGELNLFVNSKKHNVYEFVKGKINQVVCSDKNDKPIRRFGVDNNGKLKKIELKDA